MKMHPDKDGHYKLRDQVQGINREFWPTPTVQDVSNNGGPSQHLWNTKPLNAEVPGQLNPEWVTWLMGYPQGWLDFSTANPPESRAPQAASLSGSPSSEGLATPSSPRLRMKSSAP